MYIHNKLQEKQKRLHGKTKSTFANLLNLKI